MLHSNFAACQLSIENTTCCSRLHVHDVHSGLLTNCSKTQQNTIKIVPLMLNTPTFKLYISLTFQITMVCLLAIIVLFGLLQGSRSEDLGAEKLGAENDLLQRELNALNVHLDTIALQLKEKLHE